MRISSQLLLTFLLNACWQIPLIALLAACGSRLLKSSSARNRHLVWVSALLLSLAVPAITSSGVLLDMIRSQSTNPQTLIASAPRPFQVSLGDKAGPIQSLPMSANPSIQVDRYLAMFLILLYFAFVLYRCFKLIQAWHSARIIKREARPVKSSDEITAALVTCEQAIGSRSTQLLSSNLVPVPITVGFLNPLIILPEELSREGNVDLLTSAIGHEFIHVARRDYLLNFLYELIYLPVSFNPATALLRRKIKQTRELCCDELVAERLLDREVYARSLVKLASAAPPLRSLSVTTTVGIADADILEVRIMSLLKKEKMNARWKKLMLLLVALLLLVPSIAAASFAMRFDVDPLRAAIGQDQEKQKEMQKEKEVEKTKERQAESKEFREGWEAGQKEKSRTFAFKAEAELTARQEEELKMRDIMQATLVRLARVSMEQAIQIATSQQPGKVLECSLNGEHWEEPGILAKDARVVYHVTILSGDESSPTATHVLVNAVDGTIIKVEQELPRRMRSPERP